MRLKVEFELAGTLWYNTRRLSSSYKNADEFSHWKSSCCSWGTFTVTMGFIQTFWVLQNWHYSCLFGGKLAERLLSLVSKSGHLIIWSTPLLCHPGLAIHIQWENSALNHQLYHVNLKLFLYIFLLPLVFFPNQILLHTLNSILYFVRIIQSWKWQYCQNMFFLSVIYFLKFVMYLLLSTFLFPFT